jgi:Tol biopolymer transport system component
MNADDGSDVTRLTDNNANNLSPSWSPDGEKIAFSSNGDGTDEDDPNYDIYVMNADDGSGQTRLTNNNANDLASDWGINTSPSEGDGNGSSSSSSSSFTIPSQQTSDEAISSNIDNNNTNYNNHDVLQFLTDEIECFTNNDGNDLNGNSNNHGEQFSHDIQLCLYDVIGQYFNNYDYNLNNNNDSQDNNNDNISSNDDNNNDTSSQET